eukprot:CAMPEP_0170540964 /NCGR_PEP_ID=MMETSP0211-20121228/842_1 /TAXON_ID=311385 /ORGANISM="Pseudokeronopsis sp., Strain OXSARD2" /LENGTH=87 /DNA_ID=CAMNT_0010843537 /DNA_START=888 /DNA_END=1151 /DNA_ORIENTATION=-
MALISTYRKNVYLFDLKNHYEFITKFEMEENVLSFLVWDPEHVILGMEKGLLHMLDLTNLSHTSMTDTRILELDYIEDITKCKNYPD